jgi:VWFA-related protein
MRSLVSALAILGVATLAAQTPAPPPPKPAGQGAPSKVEGPQQKPPVFRTGVDLLTVDATVLDREGRQVVDLKPAEFQVEVDGEPRPVVTAEYVKLVDDTPVPVGVKRVAAPTVSPDEAFFSTNTRTVAQGRAILILVDQGNIRVGQGRHMMRSAASFVNSLEPADRLAMVAVPHGAHVDFTTEHEKVREALLATVGLATPFKGRFHISLSEAIATVEHSDASLRNQLMTRECGSVLLSAAEAQRCEIEVEQEAGEVVNHQRLQTQNSLRAMREILRSLGGLEGPKTVILISEGLVLEGLGSEVDDIAAVAADSRVSLDVMLLDVPQVDLSESQRPTTPREDRDRQVYGLESLAGMSRGALHRIITSGEHAFQRINQAIAGYYLLGVESRPRDRDGRRHRVAVKSTRRGLTVYARRGFLATTSPGATSPEDAVKKALGAPLTINELPMRVAAWTYKEPNTARVRLLLTTEIERALDQSLEYTTGIAFIDRNKRASASEVERRILKSSEADPSVAVFTGALVLDPGTYLIRIAVADSEGRIGSVDRRINAWQMNATGLTVGDLLVAQGQADPNAPMVPTIEPLVSNGRLLAMMEVYAPDMSSMQGLQGTLDILATEQGQPLSSAPMRIAAGSTPEIGILHGAFSTATLPPGRYLARATVARSGKAQGHIVRPFRVVAGAAATETAVAARPLTLPTELVGAMLTNLPVVDRKELLEPGVMNAVLTAAERARPTAKGALALARAGNLGPAALEALSAGDQTMAAFLRGVDFFSQGQMDRSIQQLQVAMQQAPAFAPARLFLGAALASGGKYREAAGLLQSASAEMTGATAVARMAGVSWLHAGDASLAIATLEQAGSDPATTRMLGIAYVIANRPADGMPLLTKSLESNPNDPAALLAGLYGVYATHSPAPRPDALAADRARAETWAKTYASLKGPHQAMIDAWINYLQGAR